MMVARKEQVQRQMVTNQEQMSKVGLQVARVDTLPNDKDKDPNKSAPVHAYENAMSDNVAEI